MTIFREDLDEVVQGISIEEKFFIGGNFNEYVRASHNEFESVHGGYSFEDRKNAGNTILGFVVSYDLILANTWFRKILPFDHL